MSLPLLLFLLATGVLEITADFGATIAVDRQPRGIAPLPPLTLTAGLHLVEVWRHGQLPWSRVVFVQPGGRLRLVVQLPTATPKTSVKSVGSEAPPPWTVTATAGVRVAHLGAHTDLDLDQHWHIEAHAPFGAATTAALTVGAATDLAGRGRLLRRVGPANTTVTRLWEARVGYAPGPAQLAAGRLLLSGPAGVLLVLDGGQGAVDLGGGFTASARAGRRADPLAQATEGAAGGAGLSIERPLWSTAVEHLFHEVHHLDLRADGHQGSWAAGGRLSLTEDGLHELRTRLQRAGELAIAARHTYRGAATSPFTDPLPGPTLLPPPGPREHRAALRLATSYLSGEVAVRLPEAAPSARQPRWIQGDFQGHRGWLGAALSGLVADVGPPKPEAALQAYARFTLQATLRRGPVRLQAEGGLSALDLRASDGSRQTRALPEAGLVAELALAQGLSIALRGGAQAVHPTWLPGGGPLWTGGLEVRLR